MSMFQLVNLTYILQHNLQETPKVAEHSANNKNSEQLI